MIESEAVLLFIHEIVVPLSLFSALCIILAFTLDILCARFTKYRMLQENTVEENGDF